MTTIHLAPANHPSTHVGADRIVNAGETIQAIGQKARKFGTTATLLLAAMIISVAVVAEQVLTNLEDGPLLLGWMALWLVGFGVLVRWVGLVYQDSALPGGRVRQAWQGFVERQKQARHDELYLETALRDKRIMDELMVAAMRHPSQA